MTGPPEPALVDAETLILGRVQRDLREGIEVLKGLVRARTRGTLGALAAAAEVAALGLLVHVKDKRIQEDVSYLLALGRRVAAGESAATLARDNLERILRKDDLRYVLRVKERAFRDIEAWLLESFERRLPDLARLATAGAAESYDALARRAFPDRAEAERIISEQHALVRRIVAHVQQHPHIVRLPSSWVLSYLNVAQEILAWDEARVRRDLDAIYAN